MAEQARLAAEAKEIAGAQRVMLAANIAKEKLADKAARRAVAQEEKARYQSLSPVVRAEMDRAKKAEKDAKAAAVSAKKAEKEAAANAKIAAASARLQVVTLPLTASLPQP
jgi:hypothetical protein